MKTNIECSKMSKEKIYYEFPMSPSLAVNTPEQPICSVTYSKVCSTYIFCIYLIYIIPRGGHQGWPTLKDL